MFSFLIIAFSLTVCTNWIIYTVNRQKRANMDAQGVTQACTFQAAAESRNSTIAAEIEKRRLEAMENNFSIYLENNLINATIDTVINARASFEAMHDSREVPPKC